MENKDKEIFSYTYSAKQQKEIEKIRKKYVTDRTDESDLLDTVKRLDASVTKKGTAISLILGILGSLILGIGMCMAMVFSQVGELVFVMGIIIGLVGIALVCVAYPVFIAVTAKEKERIAPEIVRLTDELLK